METPAHGQVQPGQDGRFATAAGICKLTCALATRQTHGALRALHGLTEAQTCAIAALIWGAMP